MLAESGLGGWGLAINLIAQRRIFPDAPDISYYKGFTAVLARMRNCAANNNEIAKFTFDMRLESEHNAGLLYDMFRMMPEYQEHTFSEISFISSRDHPKVQVADLFARETMKALDNQIGPVKREPRKPWMALFNTGRFHIDALMDGWFEDLKRKMPALEEEHGMQKERYLAWLTEKRLPHNVTNMYRYVEWLERQDREIRRRGHRRYSAVQASASLRVARRACARVPARLACEWIRLRRCGEKRCPRPPDDREPRLPECVPA